MGKANYGNWSSVTAEEDQSLVGRFLAWAQETLPCVSSWCSKFREEEARLTKIKRRTMKIIKGMDNGGSEEKLKGEGIFPWRKEASVTTSPNYSSTKGVVRKRMKVLLFTRIHMENARVTICTKRGISWYKREIFLEWEEPLMGTTSPEVWCHPYQRRWLDRVLDKFILAPFLMESWTKFVIQGHLQPWLLILWTSFLSGRYLTLAIGDGESPGRDFFAKANSISTKVILCKAKFKL